MSWIEFDKKLLHAETGCRFEKGLLDDYNIYYIDRKIINEFGHYGPELIEEIECEEDYKFRWQELKVLLGIISPSQHLPTNAIGEYIEQFTPSAGCNVPDCPFYHTEYTVHKI